MYAIKRIALSFILFSPVLACAASGIVVQTEREMYEECSAFSQAGMRECLAKKAEDSQMALQQAEKKVVSALSKWFEEDKYIKESKAKFAAANKEFIRYRKAQCAFGSSLSGGGAGGVREIGRLGCVTELNNRRAQQLLDAVFGMPSK